jgi:hypothetical protein
MAREAQMEVWSKPAWLHGRRRRHERRLATTRNGAGERETGRSLSQAAITGRVTLDIAFYGRSCTCLPRAPPAVRARCYTVAVKWAIGCLDENHA